MSEPQKTRKNRISKKARIACFRDNLPSFWAEQKEYLANMKQGVRPSKNGN